MVSSNFGLASFGLSKTRTKGTNTRSESGTVHIASDLVQRIQRCEGKFRGALKWTQSSSPESWTINDIEITKKGQLRCRVEENDLSDIENTINDPILSDTTSSKGILISHLQHCKLQLLDTDDADTQCPAIHVRTKFDQVFLKAFEIDSFLNLFASLVFWKSLKPNGIFNKSVVIKPILPTFENESNILLCQCDVFGPLPRNCKNVITDTSLPLPPDSNSNECGWFTAMGVLKYNGTLEFLLQNDGTLIYSLDITKFLRAEIQLVDSSLFQTDRCLYLGVLPDLRRQFNMPERTDCLVENSRNLFKTLKETQTQQYYIRFPLRIDLEDWYLALNSFAMPNVLSLTGTDKSNEIRISNRFKLSILEANLEDIAISSPSLYAEVVIWDHCFAKTAVVKGSQAPFWREEFEFNFSTEASDISILIKNQHSSENINTLVGYCIITQEMINNHTLMKETRLPVLSASNTPSKIGTVCLSVLSSCNFVLPPINFRKFEHVLSNISLLKIADYVYDSKISEDLKIEDISIVFLDSFQILDRVDDWFQAIIEKEFVKIEDIITRNRSQNQSSSHIFNSLFRGNSILTKTMEKYFYRLGQEYLDKCLGPVLQVILQEEEPYEIDLNRIEGHDDVRKTQIVSENFKKLYQLASVVWENIYTSSNDLPRGIKTQLKCFRKRLSMLDPDEENSTKSLINCVSGFLFLRFFCPVLLNPKLFNLSKEHPSKGSRRSLTLLTKIILNLSTLSRFGHKEPWMHCMNTFIDQHKDEMLQYVEKVTEKKLDFTPVKFRLSDTLMRPKLDLNPERLSNLPLNPFLIDKYLRATELVNAFASLKQSNNSMGTKSVSMDQISNFLNSEYTGPNEFTIGGLEFEKFSENNAEVFGRDISKILNDFSDEECDLSLKIDGTGSLPKESELAHQLEQESILIYHKLERLVNTFDDYEFPNEIILGKSEYASFIANSIYYDEQRNVHLDLQNSFAQKKGLSKLLTDKLSMDRFFGQRKLPITPPEQFLTSANFNNELTGEKPRNSQHRKSGIAFLGLASSKSPKKTSEGKLSKWLKKDK